MAIILVNNHQSKGYRATVKKVSIVVSIYNVEEYLDSLVKQIL